MTFARLSRIPKRLRDDLKIIRLLKNWKDILSAKAANAPYGCLKFRNGVELDAPREVALDFLFHEIWIDETYGPKHYEIHDGNMVVDIGANIGVFAFWAATRACDVRVKSYEPFPQNAEYFRANLKASKSTNIEFCQLAVAGSEGRRTLHVDDAWILHSLNAKESTENGLDVECTTLDKIFSNIEDCGLLKLDCEGSEYEIMYSASDATLAKISKVVCEFNNVDCGRQSGSALRDFLISKGFEIDLADRLEAESGFLCAKRTHG